MSFCCAVVVTSFPLTLLSFLVVIWKTHSGQLVGLLALTLFMLFMYYRYAKNCLWHLFASLFAVLLFSVVFFFFWLGVGFANPCDTCVSVDLSRRTLAIFQLVPLRWRFVTQFRFLSVCLLIILFSCLRVCVRVCLCLVYVCLFVSLLCSTRRICSRKQNAGL